jgi:hypothetical protein
MRLRHSNRQRPWLSGPISALPDLPGTAELRRFDNDPRACAASPSVDSAARWLRRWRWAAADDFEMAGRTGFSLPPADDLSQPGYTR